MVSMRQAKNLLETSGGQVQATVSVTQKGLLLCSRKVIFSTCNIFSEIEEISEQNVVHKQKLMRDFSETGASK